MLLLVQLALQNMCHIPFCIGTMLGRPLPTTQLSGSSSKSVGDSGASKVKKKKTLTDGTKKRHNKLQIKKSE